MKLVPYERNKLKVNYFRQTKNGSLLEEFANSGLDAAKVEGWTNATSHSAANSLNRSIERFKFANMRAIVRKGCVYLIKIDT